MLTVIMDIHQILFFAQIAVSVILIILIAVQQRGTALGSAFGGGGGEFYSARRGIQKKLYYVTIAVAGLFIVLGILNLLI